MESCRVDALSDFILYCAHDNKRKFENGIGVDYG